MRGKGENPSTSFARTITSLIKERGPRTFNVPWGNTLSVGIFFFKSLDLPMVNRV
uniref:Uncharacterized protein n=1 Tax=Picea glauca TaxID=3330 RepID=A0A101M2K8_PICGL|nr:hypothetical protein ABT39_MTgene3041 [Picea glauca]